MSPVPFPNLLRRDGDDDDSDDETSFSTQTTNLAVGAVAMFLFITLIIGTFFMLRRRRQRNHPNAVKTSAASSRDSFGSAPPSYDDIEKAGSNTNGVPRLTIQTTDANGRSSILVVGNPMLSNPDSPPHSPDNIPEIRVTFPDETDDSGRTQSGRVLVVRMGETSIGMEPVENLPTYEKESQVPFYSIDLKEDRR